MRRSLPAAAVVGAAFLFSVILLGCGRPVDEADVGGDSGSVGGGAPTAPVELKPLASKQGATLKGRVTLKGVPDKDAETMKLQAQMLAKTDQRAACYDLAPDAQKTQQVWVTDGQGGVGNVVVWIQPPPGYYFAVDLKDWKLEDVNLTQPHCAFIPHVIWTIPEIRDPKDPTKTIPTGQKFLVSNTASVSHNTTWNSKSLSGQLGTLPAGTQGKEVPLKGNNALIHFSCNIHPWMDAWVWVFDHPYAAVTKADGTYEIKNVPAGSKVRIVAWHEKGPQKYSQYLTANKSKGDDIELKDGENVHDFELEVSGQ
jgi:hypothetical protein